jgi:hypothetical protein
MGINHEMDINPQMEIKEEVPAGLGFGLFA